ncbi:MAG: hypothetical protein WBP81_27870 [Solirubrobacteraceae bacterium]
MLLVLTLLQAVSLLPLAIVHGRGGLPIIYGVILVQASLYPGPDRYERHQRAPSRWR